MIAKGTPHRDGAILARYLVTGKARERAELWELRGFPCASIVPAFRSVHVMAAATKCLAPFFHVAIRNREEENLDRSQWEVVATVVERMLGLTDQPRAVAFHTDEDTGHSHMHLAFSRIDCETLTAKPLPFFKQRLKEVCRELEGRFGLTPVPSGHSSSIRFAPTRGEDEQARRLGLDVHAIREGIKNSFDRSDCGRSFRAGLAREGLVLARGDRRDFLVVDREGGLHAVGKRIVGVSATNIRDRLSDLSPEELPTLQAVRSSLAARNEPTPPCSTVPERPDLPHISEREFQCHEKRRAAGKKQYSRSAPIEQQSAAACEPLLKVPKLSPAPPQSKENDIEESASQSSLPTTIETRIERLSITGSSPDEPSTSQETVAAEVISEAKPPGLKANGFIADLRSQFRVAVKELTTKDPSVRSKKRRREGISDVFRATAKWCLRLAALVPPFHFLDPSWEPLTWLRIWEYNEPATSDVHQECHASLVNPSPHL